MRQPSCESLQRIFLSFIFITFVQLGHFGCKQKLEAPDRIKTQAVKAAAQQPKKPWDPMVQSVTPVEPQGSIVNIPPELEKQIVPGQLVINLDKLANAQKQSKSTNGSVGSQDSSPHAALQNYLTSGERESSKLTPLAFSNLKNAGTPNEETASFSVFELPTLQTQNDDNVSRTVAIKESINSEFPGVAEFDYYVYAFQSGGKDTYHPPSRGAWGQSFSDLWGLEKISALQAWGVTSGTGIVVAVLDTGIDPTHEDIQGQLVPGAGLDPSQPNDIVDRYGHGTHVAGTIAAAGYNGKGILGVAYGAKIMPIKVLNDYGLGTMSWITSGILYAKNNGAHVINMSLGGRVGPSNVPSFLRAAVKEAFNSGVTIVAAAGNSSLDVVEFTPANIPEVIAVAATNSEDKLASFSNVGVRLAVSAPGGGDVTPNTSPVASILSLKSAENRSAVQVQVGSAYVRMAGTSMAAPHVSGLAALIKAKNPSYGPLEIRSAIMQGADDLGMPGFDFFTGAGRINAKKSLEVTKPLVAHMSSLFESVYSPQEFVVTGRAYGEGFKSWRLEYGTSGQPLEWTPIASGSEPVTTDKQLAVWQIPPGLGLKLVTMRLLVETTDGRTADVRQSTDPKIARPLVETSTNPSLVRARVEFSGSTSFRIWNSGSTATLVSSSFKNNSFTFAGGAFPGTGGTCSFSTPLKTNDSCSLVVSFSPKALGKITDEIIINYTDGYTTDIYTQALEGEGILGSAWQNPTNALDVNGDGQLSPLDALAVINDINTKGARSLDNIGPTVEPKYFIDVDGDGRLSPLDVLTVVNKLNNP